MTHAWRSRGEKRTITWKYEPTDDLLLYLVSMQDAIRYALQVAYRAGVRDGMGTPSPIQLRREIREWFYAKYDYARHHINPVSRAAVAMLRAYKKNHHGKLRIPDLKRLAMRIDTELFKITDSKIRITLRPNEYAWIPINTKNKHYQEYSKSRPSELLMTDNKVCLTFIVQDHPKLLGQTLMASDLNFGTIESSSARIEDSRVSLVGVETEPIGDISQMQSDLSRRRMRIQHHVKNPQKRRAKLKEARGRQRNRILDTLHKKTTEVVRENPGASFVFENLKGIRRSGKIKSKHFSTSLNRWPYRLYQSFVEYKSPNRTLYVNPRGTSSECPVCGGRLDHPTWGLSVCGNCGADYDRNRLASLAILCRGMRLCGQPFAVSADASWQQMRNEYLYTSTRPESERAGWTERVAYDPNGIARACAPGNG